MACPQRKSTGDYIFNNDIIIRQYRHPNDLERIRQIFVDATITGGGSPVLVVLGRFKTPWPLVYSITAFAAIYVFSAYFPSIWRATLPSWFTQSILGWSASTIGFVSCIWWTYRWFYRRRILRSFDIFLSEGLNGELKDVVANFSLHVTENGDCVPTGPGGFWVAESAGEVIGFVGLNKNMRPDPTIGDVRRLAVAPNHQGKGVAEKLMKALATHARAYDIQTLELVTSDYNEGAQRFYQRIGYELVGRKKYYDLPIIVMKQNLTGIDGD